jgi:hypothetical protein
LKTRLNLTEVQRALQDLAVANPWEAAARDQLRSGLLQDMATLTKRCIRAVEAAQAPLTYVVGIVVTSTSTKSLLAGDNSVVV